MTTQRIDVDSIVAFDVHAHVEASVRGLQDPTATKFQDAAQKYFKHDTPRPTIPEIAAYYRERRMACIVFSVDGERARGQKPVPNEEIAELAAEHADVMIPFASIDPLKGKDAVREARRLIEHYGVKGFTPDRWLEDFEKAGFRDEVKPLILKENAIELFGLRGG